MSGSDEDFLREAIRLARDNVEEGGRPFGAVVVRDGKIVAVGVNETHAGGDPTAHAELVALRNAAAVLGDIRLDGCTVYASGHPCPMCLAAMYVTGISGLAYAYSMEDGVPYGFDSQPLYAELAKPLHAQAMPMTYLPVRNDGEDDLYDFWKAQAEGG